MVDTMVNWGVRQVFGMVGHSNLGLAEAIRRRCERNDLDYIGIRHEGAASFAASAYGKLTGRPAACLSIAGPGATNLLTGLWDAKLDRVPVLALTGQVDIQFLGPGNFQEVDLASAFAAVTAWSQTVLQSALQHRGVAHLIFPNEIQEAHLPGTVSSSGPDGRLTAMEIAPPRDALEKALRLIRGSERPVIVVGHGARFCMKGIIQFAEQMNVPIITTFKGKGLVSDNHPLACGVLGLSGTPMATKFMTDSDLLIVFGASFSKHTGIAKNKPTIQVDLDPLILGKFHPVTVPIWGEMGVTLELFTQGLSEDKAKTDPRGELALQWQRWREEKTKRAELDQGKGINSASVFLAMSRQVPADAVIAVDVGNNTYSFGRYFECKSQSILMSGYLGSIGYGYPAAIGAWAAARDRPIVAVTGDGGFAQHMGELTTAVKYEIPIKHVLLNNSELGKISKEQKAEKKVVWSTTLHNPDFSRYAENCGALGIRVTDRSQLDNSLRRAFAHTGPAMVEIITDSELI
jgi:thiamine pyrophosphate-dependent acetolactate synthase large subunit-like protein